MRIANTEVTNITRNTAQVGCSKVTREEIAGLLAEMNKTPIEEFKITDTRSEYSHLNDFLVFNINHSIHGWIGVSENFSAYIPDGPEEYKWRSAFFCLRTENAEKLLEFLAKQLNRIVYKLPEYEETTRGYRRS